MKSLIKTFGKIFKGSGAKSEEAAKKDIMTMFGVSNEADLDKAFKAGFDHFDRKRRVESFGSTSVGSAWRQSAMASCDESWKRSLGMPPRVYPPDPIVVGGLRYHWFSNADPREVEQVGNDVHCHYDSGLRVKEDSRIGPPNQQDPSGVGLYMLEGRQPW